MSDIERGIIAMIPRLRRLGAALCRDRSAADDLVQDTVERALARRHLFQNGSLRAWLTTIMLNLYRNERRKLARRPVLVDVNDPAYAAHLGAAASGMDGRRLDTVRALDRLPEDQRIALLLRVVEDCSYAEIAAIQEVAIGTVMSRLARARETLRELTESGSVTPIGKTR
ncbi:RNA polymerase sigma factor [Tianweitania sediminis]|uniref:RNA polymerase sigma factor n=1 Tax=Tianweitania sediminis TaxID=1502156 RepID=A0A8J7QZ37_9HYPH|nr:RNA polymerase sigma factor [Tianweitania sediminis]MBP0438650.1 RNA polymerase sigma factor [Tianweitania sediminis]HEV7415635.1 RNA polymerase sigma factor [Tianweitania sediminis]